MTARRPALLIVAAVAVLTGCGRERPRVVATPAPRAAPATVATTVPASKPPWVAHRVVTDAVAVPGGRQHTVKFGETGIAIARAYGVPWSRVVAANHLTPPYTIEIGDKLLLPSAKAVAALSPEERARAFTVDIDDLITGAEPAGGGPGGSPATARSGQRSAAAGGTAGTAGKGTDRPARRTAPVMVATGRPPPMPAQAEARTAAATPLPTVTGPTPAFAWPLEGRVLSAFGAKPGGRFNDGVNLKASTGTAVRAAADGVVAYAGDAVAGFGNLILIKHADGWVSAYGHNEALLVVRGARVTRGEVIARSGATGAVDEPQLHFELRRGRTASDPVKLLPPRG